MSTPVPVPSKAAIRALRGLVLGTTCSLALITEDRRRKINCARHAISNAEKLKSSRNYRTDAGPATLGVREEDFLLEPWPFLTRESHQGRAVKGPEGIGAGALEVPLPQHSRASRPNGVREPEPEEPNKLAEHRQTDHVVNASQVQTQPAADPGESSSLGNPSRTPAINRPGPRPGGHPFAVTRKWEAAGLKLPQRHSKEEMERELKADIANIASMRRTGDRQSLVAAVEFLLEVLKKPKQTLEKYMGTLLETSASLSKACQRAGLMGEAAKLLDTVLHMGELEEAAYFAHDPLPIVESQIPPDPEIKLGASRACFYQYIVALELFLPSFTDRPKTRNLRVLQTGEKLMQKAFALGHTKFVDRIYNRILKHIDIGGPDACAFVQRTLRIMHEHGMDKAVVRYFLACGAELRPEREEYFQMGELVVKSVSAAYGYRAGEVLDCLRSHRPSNVRLKTSWVAELLYSHWQAHSNYGETVKLFLTLCDGGVAGQVRNPDGAYRAIIQIALEAGETSLARRHFEELVAFDSKSGKDVRILGLFALSHARAENWDSVWSLFLEMAESNTRSLSSSTGSQIFVPVLKAYSQSHTVAETEAFLKKAITDFQIPISKYMVTLVADRYGGVRDVRAFLAWLDYCSQADFKVDAAFTNAILRNCRDHWKLSFVELRAVYRKLQRLSPDFSNDVTENIMASAALSSPLSNRKVALRLVASVKPKLTAGSRKLPPDPAGVLMSMNMSLKMGSPMGAIRTYKLATGSGMPHCPRCLRAAAMAYMKLDKGNLTEPLCILQAAQEKGVDTSRASAQLFVAQMEVVDTTMGQNYVDQHVRAVIQRMQLEGVRVSGTVLNRAASACVASGNLRAAIGLAIIAAEAQGHDAPGYSAHNFSILLESYMRLGEFEGVTRLVEAATAYGFWARMAGTDLNLLKSLKQWRRKLKGAAGGGPISRDDGKSPSGARGVALEHLDMAIRMMLGERKQLHEERHIISKTALEIMGAAALESGCGPRGFAKESRRGACGLSVERPFGEPNASLMAASGA